MKTKLPKTILLTLGSLLLTNLCPAGSYVGMPSGTLVGACVTYKDATTITITSGYGENAGNYWEITSPQDFTVTNLTTTRTWHYIYIDHEANSYPAATFKCSTNVPAWNDSLRGWYSGLDRCIGAVLSAVGSATITTLQNVGNKYALQAVQIQTNGAPNGSWQATTVDLNTLTPVFAQSVFVSAYNSAIPTSSNIVDLELRSAQNPGFSIVQQAYGWALMKCWIPTGTTNRAIQWYGQADDSAYSCVWYHGFEITR